MKVKVKLPGRVQLFATPWTVACQAPPSMGFSRQEYWSGLPFPYPGGLPDPGIESRSPTFQADALTSESVGQPKSSFLRVLNPYWSCLFACLVGWFSFHSFLLLAVEELRIALESPLGFHTASPFPSCVAATQLPPLQQSRPITPARNAFPLFACCFGGIRSKAARWLFPLPIQLNHHCITW